MGVFELLETILGELFMILFYFHCREMEVEFSIPIA